MSIKEQFVRVKQNWLLLILIVVIAVFLSGNGLQAFNLKANDHTRSIIGSEQSFGGASEIAPFGGYEDFAPGEENRQIVYSSNINTEVDRGAFDDAVQTTLNVIKEHEGIVLTSSLDSFGEGFSERKNGYFSIKVQMNQYESLIASLKSVGEIESFNENKQDITGIYVSLENQLDLEKQRLTQYQELLGKSESADESLLLIDRIIEQERTIVFLEERLENQDQRIEYASISFSIIEEKSSFANIAFINVGDMIRSFVSSINSVLTLLFVLIPYAIVLLLIWFIVKKSRNNTVRKK